MTCIDYIQLVMLYLSDVMSSLKSQYVHGIIAPNKVKQKSRYSLYTAVPSACDIWSTELHIRCLSCVLSCAEVSVHQGFKSGCHESVSHNVTTALYYIPYIIFQELSLGKVPALMLRL